MSFGIADTPEKYTPPDPLPIGDIILATISHTDSWAIELGYSNTFLVAKWGLLRIIDHCLMVNKLAGIPGRSMDDIINFELFR
jgi:hypothetical protein